MPIENFATNIENLVYSVLQFAIKYMAMFSAFTVSGTTTIQQQKI